MGEVSGEVALPPQPVETKEAKSNFGLSVNGSQLIALANLDYLEEYGFVRQTKRGIVDKLKALKRLPAHQRLTSIKSLVLEGKNQKKPKPCKNYSQGQEDFGFLVHIANKIKIKR